MNPGLTQDALHIWQHLRRDGGWWDAEALHRHWYPTFAQDYLRQTLDELSRGGFAARRLHIDWGVPMYAVTPACRALPGFAQEGGQ